MTHPVVYVGEELAAAGYRLAGAGVRTPRPGEEAAVLAWARTQAPLVLVSATVAARIGEDELRAAVAAPEPLVLVVPDVHGEVPLEDLGARLRAQLGLDT